MFFCLRNFGVYLGWVNEKIVRGIKLETQNVLRLFLCPLSLCVVFLTLQTLQMLGVRVAVFFGTGCLKVA